MKHIHIPTIEEMMRPEPKFGIHRIIDGYRISGINYKGQNCAYDLGIQLLPQKTQDAHSEHAIKAGPFSYRAASLPLIHAICKTLYQNREGKHKALIETVKEFLKKQFETPLLTLSRVIYSATRLDFVVDTLFQAIPEINLTFTGPDGLIKEKNTRATDPCKAIFEDDIQEINDVYSWLTGRDTYIVRLNRPETGNIISPVTLNLSTKPEYFVVSAANFIENIHPALGVRIK